MAETTFGVEIEFIVGELSDPSEREPDEREPEDRLDDALEKVESDLDALVYKSGYRTGDRDSSDSTFGIGPDGHDTMYELPIIEIRTSVLKANENEFVKFSKFLERLAEFIKNNPETHFEPNTGLHVHVSNPALGEDPFSKLSALVGVDENQVWNDMAPLDRDLTRHALMNRHHDFEGHNKQGSHINIIRHFAFGPSTKIFTMEKFKAELEVLDRNIAVNFKSRQPTVEYRYLSSALLQEKNGIERTMNYIKYFVSHATSRTAKNQFEIKDEDDRVVFTRLPGNMVRVDHQSGERELKRVAQPGMRNSDIREPFGGTDPRSRKPVSRPIEVGVSDWKKANPGKFQQYIANKKFDAQLARGTKRLAVQPAKDATAE